MGGNLGEEKRFYDLLVEGPEDFLGIIAYSVYEQHKSEIIKSAGEDKTKLEQDVAAFDQLSRTESQRNYYKAQALDLARTFLTNAAGEYLDEQRKDIQSEEKRKFAQYKPSFWVSVWSGVVAGIISIFFLGLCIFFVNSARYGMGDAIEKGFGVKITHVEEENSSPASAAPVSSPAANKK